MKTLSFGGYVVEVDTDATAAAHASETSGGPERCGCWYCRNWIAGRSAVVPSPVRTILEDLAIPHDRETEVWEVTGDKTPHIYGGWFTFVGRLVARPADDSREFDVGGWKLSFSAGGSYPVAAFRDRDVAELHFVCEAGDFIDPAELELSNAEGSDGSAHQLGSDGGPRRPRPPGTAGPAK